MTPPGKAGSSADPDTTGVRLGHSGQMGSAVGEVARRAGLLLAVGVAYYLGARLGLRMSLVEHNVTPLWPPTGIAVAAFVLLGRSMWPAVAAAAFLVNLPISENALAAGTTAFGNLLAPLVAVVLLQRLGFRRQLDRQRDAHLLVVIALASTVLSAAVGTLTLLASGAIAPDGFLATWAVWWTGDTMGVLVVAPFLLAIPLFWELPRWSTWQWTEAVAVLVCVSVVARAGMSLDLPVLFPVLPFLGWAAWRLQLRGAAPAALVASVTTTWSVTHESGLFARGSLLEQMLTLQGFNACVALMSFFLAALVSERIRTAEMLTRGRSDALVELGKEAARSEREHEIAVALQRILLPGHLPAIPGVDVAARYIPASTDMQVGGDWYDVVQLPKGLIALAIGDVAGHGLEAAATMGQLRMAVRAYALQDPAPASVMARLHQLATQPPAATMTTLLYLVFDPDTRILRFANAGHPPALRISADATAYLSEASSPPVGVSTAGRYDESSVELAPGTTLVLYTDGLVERRGVSIQKGLDQLHDLSLALADTGLDELCDVLLNSLLDEGPVEDDVALLVLRTARCDGSPLHIEVPAEPQVLVHVRSATRRWLRDVVDDQTATEEILVACGEACNNVVEHAYGAALGTLEVDLRVVAGSVEIAIRDYGEWRPAGDRGGGWGLELTRALMDSVDVRGMEVGTEVVMRRSLSSGGVG
jgi:serine phosphatase RsbU (regulator of sigma subunit)/integral membrane sensor domain MASE1/anti-sigma regulatory factor (Ser/Thr protein kinase)